MWAKNWNVMKSLKYCSNVKVVEYGPLYNWHFCSLGLILNPFNPYLWVLWLYWRFRLNLTSFAHLMSISDQLITLGELLSNASRVVGPNCSVKMLYHSYTTISAQMVLKYVACSRTLIDRVGYPTWWILAIWECFSRTGILAVLCHLKKNLC